jgi:hypothetical protein
MRTSLRNTIATAIATGAIVGLAYVLQAFAGVPVEWTLATSIIFLILQER